MNDHKTRKSHLPSKWMGPPKNDLETPLSSQQCQLPEVGGTHLQPAK